MPQLGEIKKGQDIGRDRRHKFILAACIDCGKERWVRYRVRDARPISSLCASCGKGKSAETRKGSMLYKANPNWRGGRYQRADGYVRILLPPGDFFSSMANERGYVLEHRLIMAQHLGRCLQSWEIVHHKNGIRDDNRDENLYLAMDAGHKQITYMEKILEQQVKEIRLLKWQMSEITKQLQGSA